MWSTVGCLVALLVAFDATNALDRTKAKEAVTDFRVRSQNLHIDEAEKILHHLEEEFEHLSPEPSPEDTSRAKARLRKLEGKLHVLIVDGLDLKSA